MNDLLRRILITVISNKLEQALNKSDSLENASSQELASIRSKEEEIASFNPSPENSSTDIQGQASIVYSSSFVLSDAGLEELKSDNKKAALIYLVKNHWSALANILKEIKIVDFSKILLKKTQKILIFF